MSGISMQFGKRFLPIKFTEEQRVTIAQKVVANMSKYTDIWNLDARLTDFPSNSETN
jgi:ABC-type transport system involved in Fe-S cluster assembly fused permease/ATPase subunit